LVAAGLAVNEARAYVRALVVQRGDFDYRLPCACGSSITVREASAGAKIPCGCGRTVVVPSLRDLRRMAGAAEPSFSPEFVVEAMLVAGRLPEGNNCLLCGLGTDHSLCCMTTCELAYVGEIKPPWAIRFSVEKGLGLIPGVGQLFALIAGLLLDRTTVTGEWGRDRVFPLPLRVCPACAQDLTNPEEIKRAMFLVPVYKDLLEKYPRATIAILSQKRIC
jgi:hypothetical protein